ncbi:MAG: hypothetical protein HYY64_06730 [Candidatus Rokubacteria bacterium]|nr:hypothetical protein [Candidatus Rokubacteria bacterium]
MHTKILAAMLGAVILGTSVGWAQNFGAPLDRFFRLEWEAEQTRTGQRVVTGYVYNDHGLWADNVRLLVEVLDPAGRMVAKTTGSVNGWVPPKGRAYFWVPGANWGSGLPGDGPVLRLAFAGSVSLSVLCP